MKTSGVLGLEVFRFVNSIKMSVLKNVYANSLF